jgi:hypothetical protein
MSSSIWMQCAGASEIRALSADAWRAVEAQHQISTRKLVGSDAEQHILEELIEASKPPYRSRRKLHYLLATAFRYPPLRHGSRFATRFETSLWYGSETLHTTFAEVAYYRLLFLEGTTADLGMVETQLTAFTVPVRTSRGIDLSAKPFDTYRNELTSKESYAETQPLGTAMRDMQVQAFRYRSARDTDGGLCIAVFDADAFAATKPRKLETWHCVAGRDRVEMMRRDYFKPASHAYERWQFLQDGALPMPGV